MELMPADRVTYPPLDVPKPVADGVWIVDSGPLRMMGLPLPVRMTVLKLSNGDVLLHSPTRFDPALKRELEALGPIRHLVAPNIAHWSFLKDWQQHCPDAVTWAAPNLRQRAQVKASGVRIDRDLPAESPPEWAGDIEQAMIPGAAGFREIAFFHRPSRTLVLTDLIVNLEGDKLPLPARAFAWITGVLAPDGKAPAYLRVIVKRRAETARKAVERLVALAPERVIFAHGRWFERDGAARLRGAFRWLLG
jgi:glyoxylase-like metal-dependent hydrolase (beta-lactamase superfamily II)